MVKANQSNLVAFRLGLCKTIVIIPIRRLISLKNLAVSVIGCIFTLIIKFFPLVLRFRIGAR